MIEGRAGGLLGGEKLVQSGFNRRSATQNERDVDRRGEIYGGCGLAIRSGPGGNMAGELCLRAKICGWSDAICLSCGTQGGDG